MTRRLEPDEAAAVLASAESIPTGAHPQRAVRTVLVGRDLHGRPTTTTLVGASLVVFLKLDCDGCVELAGLVRDGVPGVQVLGALPVPSTGLPDPGTTALAGERGRWLVGADAFTAMSVRTGPFFCLVDREGRVVVEGVAFGAAQVLTHVERAIAGVPQPDAVRRMSGAT
jgi:hypothetical protein